MADKKNSILTDVAAYYSAKLVEHGETPQGVDWNSEASQMLRFEQLSKIIQQPAHFSLNDFGCGYGALFEFLTSRFHHFSYVGCDISQEMIRAAQRRYANHAHAHFMVAAEPLEPADYSVASGIFNVKLGYHNSEWKEYLETTLEVLNRFSRKGFTFNCLTSYSDVDKMRDNLYYADPCFLFDLCKRRYSRNVALLHDYDLYEFTILVRKSV
ncbi:class I SAM-dependent methyltransferase [Leptothermofonsia sp. ETS-13]|uniref:class I SAM-dependent methyltransferase n=1 Tax=Leptothermofonsia sp. ETS-13 TaxID=3035696 RepID=UPI003B9E86C6